MALAEGPSGSPTPAIGRLSSKRRFGLSLRLTLGLMAIIAVGLGLWAGQVRQRKLAIAMIQRHHGTLHYDFEVGKDGFVPNPRSWAPTWFRDMLGDENIHDVTYVRIVDETFNDADLVFLTRCFPRIRALGIDGTVITDRSLGALRGNQDLAALFVKSRGITDAGIDLLDIGSIPQLSLLDVRGTRVSDQKSKEVEKQLEDREKSMRLAHPGQRVDSHFVLTGPFNALEAERINRENAAKMTPAK